MASFQKGQGFMGDLMSFFTFKTKLKSHQRDSVILFDSTHCFLSQQGEL